MAGRILTGLLRRDMLDGGGYRIAGTVDELGAVGVYRVRLFVRSDGRYIRQTFSGSDGSYSFDYIAAIPNGYFVVAHDDFPGGTVHNAAIADLITPELMP